MIRGRGVDDTSKIDKARCIELAAHLWPDIPAQPVRVVAAPRTGPGFGLRAMQKGVVILAAGEAPQVLAEAGSWRKLRAALERMAEPTAAGEDTRHAHQW